MGLFKKKSKKFRGLVEAQQVIAQVLEYHILFPITLDRENARQWYLFCEVLEKNVSVWKRQARKKINERVGDDS